MSLKVNALAAASGFMAVLAGPAVASTVMVNATDSVYNYASNVIGPGSTMGDTVAIGAGTGRVLTFSSVTGSVTLNFGSGSNYNDPDGIGSAGRNDQSGIIGTAGLSGIVAPHAGYLAGVFLNGSESAPGHTAPLSLNFDQIGTAFSSLSPGADQVFFIGDGLTGDGSGSVQRFLVPNDATTLVLGIVDAPGYNGQVGAPPGAYGDNRGSFDATFSFSSLTAVPEPATLGILSVASLALLVGRRFKKA